MIKHRLYARSPARKVGCSEHCTALPFTVQVDSVCYSEDFPQFIVGPIVVKYVDGPCKALSGKTTEQFTIEFLMW